jgi:XRE family transcriptional regulator, regulator of sulfur utilization
MKDQRIGPWRGIPLVALFWLSGCVHGPGHSSATSLAATHATAPAKPLMHSRVFQWSDMQERPSNIGAVRNVFDSPTLTLAGYSCHITTLNPGKEPHPPHQHPEEELLVIKEGTLEVMQNGVTNQVSAGGMVFCASNELHGWRNTSSAPVTYYVIKVSPYDLKVATNEIRNVTTK